MIKKLARQKEIDFKDREYDSDDDLKKSMMTYDDRLTFINKFDADLYRATDRPLGAQIAQKESKLPIVLHEREIME